MEKILTPDEEGKKILAQQAKEQTIIARQAEEDEAEDEKKLRLFKEREAMAFLTYARIRAEEEKAKQEHDKFVSKLLKDFLHTRAYQAQVYSRMVINNLAQHNQSVTKFITEGEAKEVQEKRSEMLKETGIKLSEFSSIAMTSLSKKEENRDDIEKVFSGKAPSDNLKLQRKEAVKNADEAIVDFSAGNVKKMEKMIAEGLVSACHFFTHTKDTIAAIHWSKQINNILCVVSSHPVLFKEGPNTKLLESATGIAALGRVMENGFKALERFYSNQLNHVKMTDEEEITLQQQILLMQQVDDQRSSEKYQKLFSKGYSPENGLNQDNLNSLLKMLDESKAIRTLSKMTMDEKLFALADSESRRTLSADLFVPCEGKNVARTDRKPEKKVMQAHS